MIKFNVTMLKISLFTVTFLFFLFSASGFAQEGRFYKLNLVNTQEKLQLKDIVVFPGSISTVSTQGNYKYELLSLTGSSIYANHFDIPPSTRSIRIFDSQTGQSTFETVKEDSVSIVLAIPYFPNGKEIGIYDSQDKKVLTIPVGHFAEITPSPVPPIVVTKLEKGSNTLLYVGLGGLVFGIAFVAYLFIQSRKKDNQLQ